MNKKNLVNLISYKLKISIIFVIWSSLLFFSSMPNIAFANHMSEKMTWQIVFVSSYPACSNYQYQMTNRFHSITDIYLTEYGIEHRFYPPKCISIEKYPQEYEQHYDIDLFILVYDKNLGREKLHGNDIGGYYTHYGPDRTSNHVIVFCDCPNFNFSNPVWVLSHELSHFSLMYLGYDPKQIEEIVHENDHLFDKCQENWESECASIRQKIVEPYGKYAFSVMPVYKPSIVEKNILIELNDVSPEIVEVSKQITKWWGFQEPIDDESYAYVMRILGSDEELYIEDKVIEFMDEPIKDEITWEEHLYGVNTFSSTQITSHIPFIEKGDQGEEIVIPDWFKKISIWWADGEISNEELANAIHFLKEEGTLDQYYDIRFLLME